MADDSDLFRDDDLSSAPPPLKRIKIEEVADDQKDRFPESEFDMMDDEVDPTLALNSSLPIVGASPMPPSPTRRAFVNTNPGAENGGPFPSVRPNPTLPVPPAHLVQVFYPPTMPAAVKRPVLVDISADPALPAHGGLKRPFSALEAATTSTASLSKQQPQRQDATQPFLGRQNPQPPPPTQPLASSTQQPQPLPPAHLTDFDLPDDDDMTVDESIIDQLNQPSRGQSHTSQNPPRPRPSAANRISSYFAPVSKASQQKVQGGYQAPAKGPREVQRKPAAAASVESSDVVEQLIQQKVDEIRYWHQMDDYYRHKAEEARQQADLAARELTQLHMIKTATPAEAPALLAKALVKSADEKPASKPTPPLHKTAPAPSNPPSSTAAASNTKSKSTSAAKKEQEARSTDEDPEIIRAKKPKTTKAKTKDKAAKAAPPAPQMQWHADDSLSQFSQPVDEPRRRDEDEEKNRSDDEDSDSEKEEERPPPKVISAIAESKQSKKQDKAKAEPSAAAAPKPKTKAVKDNHLQDKSKYRLLQNVRSIIVTAHSQKPRSLIFSPTQADTFATTSLDGSFTLWRRPEKKVIEREAADRKQDKPTEEPVEIGTLARAALKHSRWPEDMCWSDSGERLAIVFPRVMESSVEDKSVKASIINPQMLILNTAKLPRISCTWFSNTPHSKDPKRVLFLPRQDNKLVTVGADHKVFLWNVNYTSKAAESSVLHSIHSSEIYAAAFTKEAHLLTGACDKKIIAFDVEHKQERWSSRAEFKISHLLENPTNPNLFLVAQMSLTNPMTLFDTRSKVPCLDLTLPETNEKQSSSQYIVPSWHSNGEIVACGCPSPVVNFWDVRYAHVGAPTQVLDKRHELRILHSKFHPHYSDVLVTLSSDKSLGWHEFKLLPSE